MKLPKKDNTKNLLDYGRRILVKGLWSNLSNKRRAGKRLNWIDLLPAERNRVDLVIQGIESLTSEERLVFEKLIMAKAEGISSLETPESRILGDLATYSKNRLI